MSGILTFAGNQLSISKYEELLVILMDHKLTFENHLLNIEQKADQKSQYLSTCLRRS